MIFVALSIGFFAGLLVGWHTEAVWFGNDGCEQHQWERDSDDRLRCKECKRYSTWD